MSNPPIVPENAAAADAAAVSPVRTAIGITGDAALSFPEEPAQTPQTPPPCPPATATAAQEQGPVSSVPPPPSQTPAPPAGQQGSPGTVPLAAQATGTSAAAHADPVKYARGPAALQRPHGPSLLTQALATARGIPRQAQPDPSHPNKAQSSQPQAESQDSPARDPNTRASQHDSVAQRDSDSLTARVSPRKTTMPSSTATATTVVAPPAYGRLDLGEVNSMLSGHREFLSKKQGRTGSQGAVDREQPSRWNTYTPDKTGITSLTSPRYTDSPVAQHDGADDGSAVTNGRPQPRAWKTDNRVSVGPEKAWSIGSGDAANGEDGQVEKSISEVLAGVEHNNRSRKASHSLRFFKEGLPEEKGKRKDQRSSYSTREKSPSRGEKLADIQEQPANREVTETPSIGDDALVTGRKDWVRPVSAKIPGAKTTEDTSGDYFAPKHGEHVRATETEPAVVERDEGVSRHQEADSTDVDRHPKPRRVSDLSIGAGESTEEGEESGEEKISSAVFLPHQTPAEGQERAPTPGIPQRIVPSRRHSRNGDFHPWLVKADEPEVDDKRESLDLESEAVQDTVEYPPSVYPVLASRQVEDSATVDQRESAVSSRLSRPVSEYHEDAVHDHQLAPEQPLDAIELIPYKHQVGGHTTLWRFSRRAVCKQLNNRENEFYEKIERYHRDLLAFLPRYIGVLNVTFQKQPRRKSTMRRDDAATLEPSHTALNGSSANPTNGTAQGGTTQTPSEPQTTESPRVISQSMKTSLNQIPTVTFADNQHILPRSLLQPNASLPNFAGRFRSASATFQGAAPGSQDGRPASSREEASRPSLSDRHANSWGATTVNKKLRNEVFNDAFLKQPIAIHRHRKGHRRVARRTLQQSLRPSGSDPSLIESHEKRSQSAGPDCEPRARLNSGAHTHSHSDLGQAHAPCVDDEEAPKDVTGTSAPEPEILGDSSPAQKKKRRFSGTGLRRKPTDVREGRGDLKYFAEADDAGSREDKDDTAPMEVFQASPEREPVAGNGAVEEDLALAPAPPAGPLEFGKIPRPINPKEAQTQRDSRVEYFLLLEDLTAGMKRPCIMDLKMGTRQYGVEANAKKQKSQQGKCAKTTSRELGVRVCGLQVWDVKTQSYVFKDKYYGRELKKGAEFQAALTRFLYDGVDRASILRHIPTVLQKLDELEVIIKRLRGYRFYAASLLMFYDGDNNNHNTNGNNHYIDDSTTDFATDTEEAPRRSRKNPREIDFKMADFANCVTAGDLSARDRPCPPRHPDEPDRGFLRGLRSLRKYFLRIQRDTRREMGLVCLGRNGVVEGGLETEGEGQGDSDEGNVSE